MSRSPEGYGSGASGLIHLAAKESKRPPMISLSLEMMRVNPELFRTNLSKSELVKRTAQMIRENKK